ncbi:ribosome biogenesis protein Pescadillo [Morchella snyderi]|nr:ribosome biogenesis protein Pescadillo [Morchella snyderi]
MGRIKKKGVSGNAKNFITRTKAVRKLQVSLPDFRRLCIFKGIYPREPRNKRKANKGSTAATTFYYTKDIQYLLHEPVLEKFREHKAFAKKLNKALGRGDYSDAKRLETNNKPQVKLDHIIKERYPNFTDALRDLDDAVSMLFLFANLPTNHNLNPETIATCERLSNEWQHYIIRTHSLRKSFLSIKGIYYQAEIQGQEILWLVPYKFAQNVPIDVDFRVMGTFVEFYSTLVGFVLFRLYTKEGIVYPPKFDADADSKGAGLRAFSLEAKGVGLLPAAGNGKSNTRAMSRQLATLSEKIASLEQKDEEDPAETNTLEEDSVMGESTIDTFKPVATGADVLLQPHMSNVGISGSQDPANLFAPFTFFLSRETPRQPLEFLLRSFGCKRIGWDLVLGEGAFTENENDPLITHQIVDRPPAKQVALPLMPIDGGEEMVDAFKAKKVNGRIPGRIYVQPQYIWDCVNVGRLLSPAEYGPGALLPPHLSPWVKVDEKTYDPTAPNVADEETSEDEEDDIEGGMEVDLESGDGEDEHEAIEVGALEEEELESEDEEEKAQQEHQRELEAEAAGVKLPAGEKKKKEKKKSRQEREEEEQKEMQKIMMSRKKRKLYEKMQFSNKKKEEEVENLREKRRKIEKEKRKAKGG